MSSGDGATRFRTLDRVPAPAARAKPVRRPRATTALKPLAHDGGMARAGLFSKFAELIESLGGDPGALLQQAQLDRGCLEDENRTIPYVAMAQALELAAEALGCPDLGMRLASIQTPQGATRALGPLGIAMRNAPTLREALHYCADHVHAYSTGTRLWFEKLPDDGRVFLLVELALPPALQAQATEHALALICQAVDAVSGGQARPPEIWFSHDPLAPLPAYRNHFNATLRFGQSMTGLFFQDADFDLAVPDRDPQLYEIATSFIDQRFPATPRSISTRVRIIVMHLLAEGNCTYDRVAATLCLHPRTLQRRLRDEGESFESIKDQVRREVALRHLGQSNVSLVKMTEMLGYSETSVLTRSCQRWFSASPRQLRKAQWQAAAAPSSQGQDIG